MIERLGDGDDALHEDETTRAAREMRDADKIIDRGSE